MRLIKFIFIILIISAITYLTIQKSDLFQETTIEKWNYTMPKESKLKSKDIPEERKLSKTFQGDLFDWIGKTSEALLNKMGEPKSQDLSAYGYTWWVYKDSNDQYIQFGIKDDKIVTIFAAGEDLGTDPLKIGQKYDSVKDEFHFDDKVNYRHGVSTYQFELTTKDLKKQPLIKVTDNVFVQLYFDTFNERLTSLRILDGDVLLKHRPYQMVYRGSLEEPKKLSDDKWLEVEKGMEQQIFDITNVIRKAYDKNELKWEESVREVAFLHSKDMEENDYFSHHNLDGGGLKERLADKDIFYSAAGENIAAEYSDAPAVVAGWLNSEEHRDALLNESYTHLGVGVYRLYYTQNFLTKYE